jgi:methylmalonyl-CoA mutase
MSAERIRVVTAASLFDGHDAAINIMRRLLQAQGAEVIHLGHDRCVDEIVQAAIEEDAHAVAVSSYQGGHLEFFAYLVDQLAARGAGHIRVYGGGGGTIVPEERAALEARGVARIFGPEDGRRLGLDGMIGRLLEECRAHARRPRPAEWLEKLSADDPGCVAGLVSFLEAEGPAGGGEAARIRATLADRANGRRVPVIGFTGTGGAGKSSVVDEIVRRFRLDSPSLRIGVVLVDPTRRRSGGALLGDRIRMNAIHGPGVFVRSLATRQAHLALSAAVRDATLVLRAAGFDLLFVETAGIGQSDSEVVDLADASIYVMTPEYGAPSQLEKIDMLELADLVVLNKSDRRGAADALRDVRRQWRRNHPGASGIDEELPVFPTVASQWDDPGLDRLYAAVRRRAAALGAPCAGEPDTLRTGPAGAASAGPAGASSAGPAQHAAERTAAPPPLVPAGRERYLAEVAEAVRAHRRRTEAQAVRAREVQALRSAREAVADAPEAARALEARLAVSVAALDPGLREALEAWPATRERYEAERQSYGVRGREIEAENHVETLSGTKLPRVSLPRGDDWGELARFLGRENLPGRFPFTAGVFPFKRSEEDPARMFAGEGPPERTNRRFHLLAAGQPATRLSTAFDSVTLYGRDPDERLDVWGKVGTSGVSVCTLDDAKKLYSGFDLADPRTSVSMTINGPAPTVLAFFLNAAIDQGVEKHLRERGELDAVRRRFAASGLPAYDGPLPPGHDGLGLGLLGIRGDQAVDADTYARIRADVLQRVRGTVQADILKEDQAQNTCIFSTAFSLKLMGDVQEWFVAERVRNFYAVSVSGYHIAEAGAFPITQLAFTLANGFTYVEAWRARGMAVDDFAPNFSFFFSNGLDAEYSVIGRVARRIWAIAMRDLYGASERSQKLKYHVQTSGRSLHAQEMAFNDIRTTLQALTAIQDHCNSLHTNAYDEAVTTPTEDSVRRALAIQLVIQRELGIAKSENALQGSYAIEWLTDRVEEAVLEEFERLSSRGGVLGAMETHYQRGRIQDESLRYEAKKHSGELPIVGVNIFEGSGGEGGLRPVALMRASEQERRQQLEALHAFQTRHRAEAGPALARLQAVARAGGNVFAELMETVKVASLGQITEALFAVGGRYRRSL